MTQATPIYDELVIVFVEREFEPPCEHFEHGQRSEWHDEGSAKFELILPCGKPFKVCAQFVRMLDVGGHISCNEVPGERHDKSSIVWVAL